MKNINEIMLAAHAVESVDSEGNSPEVYTEATGKGSYAISSYGRVALDTAALHLFKPPGLAHRGHGDFKTDGPFNLPGIGEVTLIFSRLDHTKEGKELEAAGFSGRAHDVTATDAKNSDSRLFGQKIVKSLIKYLESKGAKLVQVAESLDRASAAPNLIVAALAVSREMTDIGEAKKINFDREVWEGWTVGDFIKELELAWKYKKWNNPTKPEMAKWLSSEQPSYKKRIPEVVAYFWDKYQKQKNESVDEAKVRVQLAKGKEPGYEMHQVGPGGEKTLLKKGKEKESFAVAQKKILDGLKKLDWEISTQNTNNLDPLKVQYATFPSTKNMSKNTQYVRLFFKKQSVYLGGGALPIALKDASSLIPDYRGMDAKAVVKAAKRDSYAGGILEDTIDESRDLSLIASEIRRDWKQVNFAAKPYLEAMAGLSSIKDKYGYDDGKTIVAYFLSNAASWKGPKAKEVKAELKKMMKESVDEGVGGGLPVSEGKERLSPDAYKYLKLVGSGYKGPVGADTRMVNALLAAGLLDLSTKGVILITKRGKAALKDDYEESVDEDVGGGTEEGEFMLTDADHKVINSFVVKKAAKGDNIFTDGQSLRLPKRTLAKDGQVEKSKTLSRVLATWEDTLILGSTLAKTGGAGKTIYAIKTEVRKRVAKDSPSTPIKESLDEGGSYIMGTVVDSKQVVVKIPSRDGKTNFLIYVNSEDQYVAVDVTNAFRIILVHGTFASLDKAKAQAKKMGFMSELTGFRGFKKPQAALGMESTDDIDLEGLDEDFKVTPADMKVLKAFVAQKAASSKALSTNGKTLDIEGMGGKDVAVWTPGGQVIFPDTGKRSAQTIERALRKLLPKSAILESGLDEGNAAKEERTKMKNRDLIVGLSPGRQKAMFKLIDELFAKHKSEGKKAVWNLTTKALMNQNKGVNPEQVKDVLLLWAKARSKKNESEHTYLESGLDEASKEELMHIMQFLAVMVWKGAPVALAVIASSTGVSVENTTKILKQLDKAKYVQFDGKKAQITKKGSSAIVPHIVDILSVKEHRLDEGTDFLALYNRLKKGDKVDIMFNSTWREATKPLTYVVTSPHRVVGKSKVGRIILKDVTNLSGVKYFWYLRDGKVGMASGNMAVQMISAKMSTGVKEHRVDEGIYNPMDDTPFDTEQQREQKKKAREAANLRSAKVKAHAKPAYDKLYRDLTPDEAIVLDVTINYKPAYRRDNAAKKGITNYDAALAGLQAKQILGKNKGLAPKYKKIIRAARYGIEEMKNQTPTRFVEHGEVLPEAELALSFLSTVDFGACFESEEEGVESLSGHEVLERIDLTALAESYVTYVDMSTQDGSLSETLQRAAVASLLGVDFDGDVVDDLTESDDPIEKGLRLSEVSNMLGTLLSNSVVVREGSETDLEEVTQCHIAALVAAASDAVPAAVDEDEDAEGILVAEGFVCSVCDLDLTHLDECVLCEDEDESERVPAHSHAVLETPFEFGHAIMLTQLDEDDEESYLSFDAVLDTTATLDGGVEDAPFLAEDEPVVAESRDAGLSLAESLVSRMVPQTPAQ